MRHQTLLLLAVVFSCGVICAQEPTKSPAESDARLHSDGKGWRLDQAKIVDTTRPRVLLIGDSILNGYLRYAVKGLEGKAYVDGWVNPYHQSEHVNKLLAEVLEKGPYDVVHFNMGLHGWQEGRIKPGTFEPLTKAYVEVIREKLPNAKIIWANSTPVTTTEKPLQLEPEINPVIIEHNRMAAHVMQELHVPVNDFYSLLVDRMDLARGDRFHWTSPAYEMLGQMVVNSVLRELQSEPVTSWKYPPEMPGARVEAYRKVGDVTLNAWIFEPQGHTANDRRAAAVFFFGGGWNGGTPGQFLPQCQHLAERGMVAISVDYRVKSRQGVLPQDCVRDAKAAIRWVRANADRLGIDPDRIASGGGSAGGHLAAAVSLVPEFEEGDHLSVSSAPNAMLLFNPAVVLAAVDGHPELLPEGKVTDIANRCDGRPQEISPYHFIRSELPPAIIFHGTNDEAVPFGTVELFASEMQKAGNRCELKAYEGQPHGFFNPGRGQGAPRVEATRRYYQTLAQLDEFLESLGYIAAPDADQ